MKSKHMPEPVLEATESTNAAIQAGGKVEGFDHFDFPSKFLFIILFSGGSLIIF